MKCWLQPPSVDNTGELLKLERFAGRLVDQDPTLAVMVALGRLGGQQGWTQVSVARYRLRNGRIFPSILHVTVILNLHTRLLLKVLIPWTMIEQ